MHSDTYKETRNKKYVPVFIFGIRNYLTIAINALSIYKGTSIKSNQLCIQRLSELDRENIQNEVVRCFWFALHRHCACSCAR